MFLNKFSYREKKLLYTAIIVISCVLLYVFLLDPIWEQWEQLNEQIYAKERKLLKNMKIIAQRKQIAELYDKYEEDIKMQGSVEEETAVILREIENIARKSNTHITDIKPHKVKDMGFYKEYYVELESEADIADIAKFIYGLQTSKQILKVRHLRINAKAGRGDVLKAYMVVTKILIP